MVDGVDASPPINQTEPTEGENQPQYIAATATPIPDELHNDVAHTDTTIEGEQPIEQEHPVIIAESIARIKTSIERMIFLEYLPSSQWREALEAELSKYPETKPYRSLMENVINRAIKINENIRRVWDGYADPDERFLDQAGPNAATPKATPRMASQMYEGIFGRRPTGELEVYRGAAAIRFVVDDEDFRSIAEYEHKNTVIESGGFTFVDSSTGIPIIVMRQSLVDSARYVTIVHELEHAKHKIHWLNPMAPEILLDQERLEIASASWERWGIDDTFIDRSVKGEILAYATYLELFPEKIPVSQRAEFDQHIRNYFEETKRTLNNPDGLYLPRYREETHLEEQQYEQYMRSVDRNIDAYIDLHNHYRSQGMSIPEAGRMAINVLTQFPLQKWAAVTRLVIRRTQQNNRQEQDVIGAHLES